MSANQWLAAQILRDYRQPATESDIALLAKDLEGVVYDARVDGPYRANASVTELFCSRIAGGSLSTYLECLRIQARQGR